MSTFFINMSAIEIEHTKSGGLILHMGGYSYEITDETAEQLGLALIKASVNTDRSDE